MAIKVAIHQPNYFPWLGYFYKMLQTDIFIFLDTVQFSKNSYQNRVKIMTSQGAQWLTQPVSTAGNFGILTCEVQFAEEKWPEKHFKMLKSNYARAAYWKDYEEEIFTLLNSATDLLAETNIRMIKWMASKLSIHTDFRSASDLGVDDTDPTERLVKLVSFVGGDIYIHGKGGVNYQHTDLFRQKRIILGQSNFSHPIYRQLWSKEFMVGLSAIDLLLNTGSEAGFYLNAAG